MKSLALLILIELSVFRIPTNLAAQNRKILVDVGHGQKFYSDPADNISTELVPTDRLRYMTGELMKNAAANNASVGYIKKPITANLLTGSSLLFIHAPSMKYTLE
ncbi:MAG TPA: hypothetical protein VLC28_11165 [Flavitalea sp.]|nr:hypothetical protein [Flavitalea sp.]